MQITSGRDTADASGRSTLGVSFRSGPLSKEENDDTGNWAELVKSRNGGL